MALENLEEFEEWITIQNKLKTGELFGYFREIDF